MPDCSIGSAVCNSDQGNLKFKVVGQYTDQGMMSDVRTLFDGHMTRLD